MTEVFNSVLVDRFWAKVNKGDECWLWSGAHTSQGYGHFRISTHPFKTLKAHRFSWILHHGDIQNGLHVCHKCDVPSCVNPAHLFLGTKADNVADMVRKGRSRKSIGELNPRAKLTAHDVIAIRKARASGSLLKALASKYGVTRTNIGDVILRKTWAHIT